MSLHPTRSHRWEVRWREGVRNRSRTFDRKSDALQFEAEARRIRQLGGLVPSRTGGLTLGEFAEQWFVGKRDLAPKTRFEYAKTLDRHVEPFLGHLPLTEIRPLLLNEWQQQRLAAGAGREAIAKAEKLLGQILSRAVALELLASNAALTLQHPRANARKPTIATPVDVEAIRTWFLERGRLGDAALISLLAYVGVRPMEALALRWSDLDGTRLSVAKALSDGVFKTTKTRNQRLVQVPRPVVKDLHEWRIAMGRRQHLIWPRRLDGGPWHQADWNNWRRRWFKKAAKAAGIEHLVPYDLRHSAASIYIAAGRPQTEVAAQLGHSLEVSTRTYQHLIESTQGQPSKSIDAWIREAREVRFARARGVSA